MEIREIQAALPSSDSQDRLPGVRAVRKGDSAVALPILLRKVKDGEFMVRFVAMRWRQTQTAEALAALLKMMHFDRAIRMCDPKPLTLCQGSGQLFVAMTICSSAAVHGSVVRSAIGQN